MSAGEMGVRSNPANSAASKTPITLAVPYHSGFELLLVTLRSIASQRHGETRALLCDDSPGGLTEQQLAAMHALFPAGRPLSVLRNPVNLGMARAWNRCLDEAESDLVTLVHGDDELDPEYARAMVELAERRPDATAMFSGARIIGQSGQSTLSFPDLYKELLIPAHDRELLVQGDRGLSSLLRGNYIFCPSVCYRKSRLGDVRFDPRFRMVLDFDLTTRLLLDGHSLVGVPKRRLYRYRRHEQNATQHLTKELTRFREESDLYLAIAQRCRELGYGRSERKAQQRRIIALNLLFCMVRDAGQREWRDLAQKSALFRELFL